MPLSREKITELYAKRRLTLADAGTAAYDTLDKHPGGLNRRMWCEHANLTPTQLSRGIAWLRDLFDERVIIKVYRSREWIYSLGQDRVDVDEFNERQLRSQITRSKREFNDWHAINLEYPTLEHDRQEELARRRLQDLEYAYGRLFGEDE